MASTLWAGYNLALNSHLTAFQVACIRDGALKYFSATSRVWLFGSRVDDQSRGGDIDLYIEPEAQDPEMLVDAKLEFLLEIHRHIGEQKIDVVLHRNTLQEELPIYRITKENGRQLL